MSFLRVYGQWIVVTILVGTVLFASAGRLDLAMFWAFVVAHSGSHPGDGAHRVSGQPRPASRAAAAG